MLQKWIGMFAIVLATGAGCAFDDDGLPLPGGETLQERLGQRETLVLDDASQIGIAARDAQGNALPQLEPVVRGGAMVVRSTQSGLLLIEDMTIYLSDVYVPPGVLHSQQVQLTDIELRLGTQIVVEAEWEPGGHWASGVGSADLLMDWAVRDKDGNVLPLATQRLRDGQFDVVVELRADGSISANLGTAIQGRLGGFANRIELSDFTMTITGVSPVPQVD